MAPRLIAIVGPTASGKSALALRLAREQGAEIVSCDSLQVYRGLDVGSAKPSPEDRRLVPHHLLDVVDPDQDFSAAAYACLAREAIAGIVGRRWLPLVVGGAGLYLRALFGGLFVGPGRDERLRKRLEAVGRRGGDERLHRLLRRVDPMAAARIHPRDRLRVVRALEVFRASGQPISAHQRQTALGLLGHEVLVLGLAPPRSELRRAVEQRTRAMFAVGLLEEARGLLDRGYSPDLRPFRAIGYRQAFAVLRGELTREAAERDIVSATMRYAKRQMTWFRHQARVDWHAEAEAALGAAQAWLARPPAD